MNELMKKINGWDGMGWDDMVLALFKSSTSMGNLLTSPRVV